MGQKKHVQNRDLFCNEWSFISDSETFKNDIKHLLYDYISWDLPDIMYDCFQLQTVLGRSVWFNIKYDIPQFGVPSMQMSIYKVILTVIAFLKLYILYLKNITEKTP